MSKDTRDSLHTVSPFKKIKRKYEKSENDLLQRIIKYRNKSNLAGTRGYISKYQGEVN